MNTVLSLLISDCRELHRRARDRDPRIVNVHVMYRELNEHAIFVDAGADLAQRVQRVNMHLFVVAAGVSGESVMSTGRNPALPAGRC